MVSRVAFIPSFAIATQDTLIIVAMLSLFGEIKIR